MAFRTGRTTKTAFNSRIFALAAGDEMVAGDVIRAKPGRRREGANIATKRLWGLANPGAGFFAVTAKIARI